MGNFTIGIIEDFKKGKFGGHVTWYREEEVEAKIKEVREEERKRFLPHTEAHGQLVKELLAVEIEEELDLLNGREGTTERLCLFCNSKDVDTVSNVGIIHKPTCLIIKLRAIMKGDEQ